MVSPFIIATGINKLATPSDHAQVVSEFVDCHIDPFPSKLYRAAGCNGMICGGMTLGRNTTSFCWSLNPSGTWTQQANMNHDRHSFSLTLFENRVLFAIGGAYNKDFKSEKYLLASVESLAINVTRPNWVELEDAPRRISQHCTVALESYLFLLGGTVRYRDHGLYYQVIVDYFNHFTTIINWSI